MNLRFAFRALTDAFVLPILRECGESEAPAMPLVPKRGESGTHLSHESFLLKFGSSDPGICRYTVN